MGTFLEALVVFSGIQKLIIRKLMTSLHSFFLWIIRKNTNVPKKVIVFIQIQIMARLLEVDMIYMLVTIVLQIRVHTVIFRILMVYERFQSKIVKLIFAFLKLIIFRPKKLKFTKSFYYNNDLENLYIFTEKILFIFVCNFYETNIFIDIYYIYIY